MSWGIIFEYELPRERGRRPDVIILSPTHAFILEFKDSIELTEAFVDQTLAYALDLQSYHSYSQKLCNVPILVLTKMECNQENKGVIIVGPGSISEKLSSICHSGGLRPEVIGEWLSGTYSPLPSLVNAARMIFNNEPLPQIKRALSAGIPQTLHILESIVKEAQEKGEVHLALVTGVPGAGKTLSASNLSTQVVQWMTCIKDPPFSSLEMAPLLRSYNTL
jgi:hypothetical protein